MPPVLALSNVDALAFPLWRISSGRSKGRVAEPFASGLARLEEGSEKCPPVGLSICPEVCRHYGVESLIGWVICVVACKSFPSKILF